jgi:hypothetical protein
MLLTSNVFRRSVQARMTSRRSVQAKTKGEKVSKTKKKQKEKQKKLTFFPFLIQAKAESGNIFFSNFLKKIKLKKKMKKRD